MDHLACPAMKKKKLNGCKLLCPVISLLDRRDEKGGFLNPFLIMCVLGTCISLVSLREKI